MRASASRTHGSELDMGEEPSQDGVHDLVWGRIHIPIYSRPTEHRSSPEPAEVQR